MQNNAYRNTMNKKPKIFISYSWKDKNIADSIDNDFKNIGITFIRDIRDLQYKNSIKKFMQKVRKTDFVLMLISDGFLKSKNCMYEVHEFLKEQDYKNKMLHIILPDANIFSTESKIKYTKYWIDQYNTLNKNAKKLDPKELLSISEDLKHLDNICNSIGDFLNFISDELSVSYEKLKKTRYKAILEYIKFVDENLIQELFKIQSIEDIEEKEIAIEEFILNNPDYSQGYFFKAYNEKNYKKQIIYYNKVIELNPEDADAYNNKGIAKAGLGLHEDAILYYNKSIELNSENAEANINRGVSKIHMGLYNEAIKDLKKTIELFPGYSAKGYLNMGYAKGGLRLYEEAIEDYKKDIKIDPQYAEAYFNMGNIKGELRLFNEAIKDFEKAIEINPKYVEAYCTMGNVKRELKLYNEAIIDFEKAIKLDPQYTKAYFSIGNTKRELRLFNEAIKNYIKAIEIDPNMAVVYYLIGVTKIELGLNEEAKKYFKKAFELNPELINTK